ncbi:MAG: DinB family protein [Fimbriimonas sp.]
MSHSTPEAASLRSACSIFTKDLQALPEEAFTKQFSAKARTVADIVYEVNMVNDHIGMNLRGEEAFAWPEGGWITAPADFNTKEIVIQAFEESAARIQATADSYSAEDLLGTIPTEHGDKTRAERLRFIVLHLWYHSGQLNFIQTLLGDDEWHW